MAEPQITVKVDGAPEVIANLRGLNDDLTNFQDAMSKVGDKAKRYFSGQVFASRGGAINEPWPALNSRYAVQKARRWPGRPPLIQTGKMQSSFTSVATPTSVTIGNDDPKFKYHQSSAARNRLPRRAMIGVYASLGSDTMEIVSDAVIAKVKARMG